MPKIVCAVLVSAWAISWAPPATACACCAERGMWVETQHTFPESGSHRDALISGFSRLHLTGTLHSAEYGKGSEILDRSYAVTLRFEPGGWWINVVLEDGGERLLMVFDPSEAYEEFYADTGRGEPGAVELYKEMRLDGTLKLANYDIPVVDRSRATLVLQGFSTSACLSLSAFDHWILNFEIMKDDIIEQVSANGDISGDPSW